MASVVSPQYSMCIIADYGCEYRMEEWLLQCCSAAVCRSAPGLATASSSSLQLFHSLVLCTSAALQLVDTQGSDTPTNISFMT